MIVVTVRAIKYHGGVEPREASLHENLDALRLGCSNVIRHILNVRRFGVPVVVAINRFLHDTENELALVKEMTMTHGGASAAVVCDHWSRGGAGAVDLAQALIHLTSHTPADFKLLYLNALPLKDKIEIICREIYGADGVEYLNDT